MVMAFDEGSPAPPPAPVAHLPRLPSNAEIVCPRNADVSLLILRAVLSRGAHRPGGNTYRKVAALCGRTRLCVAGERLKPQRSPTRKKMVTCFPPLQPACRLRARCAADAQRMRSGCAADAQRMRSRCAADVGVKTTLFYVEGCLWSVFWRQDRVSRRI